MRLPLLKNPPHILFKRKLSRLRTVSEKEASDGLMFPENVAISTDTAGLAAYALLDAADCGGNIA